MKGLSTDMSVTKLLKHIYKGVDSKKYGICVFLDLREAFDKVDTQFLLAKLNTYGVRGSSLQLLCSYLQYLYHYVSINNVDSSISPVGMGVP